MRSSVSYRRTGIILILTRLLVQVLSDELASSEEYRFDKFNGKKYQNSVEEPVIRLFDDHTISKNININSNILFSSRMGNTDELMSAPVEKAKQDAVMDELTMRLYAAVIFRENILRVFGHALYVSESQISANQYSSLYIIHEALRRNLVHVFNMLPTMHRIQGQRKITQWKVILIELTKNLPPYLESTAEFLVQEIYGKRFSPEALFPFGVQGLPDFLDHLEPELINHCKIISSTDARRSYDESSEMTEKIFGPIFIKVLYNIINGQINFTQRLFAAILMSLPQNGLDPILDENIRYIFELSKFELIPFWKIASLNPEATDPYELIHSTISKILNRNEIPIFVRESLFYIKNHLSPITVKYINPMHNPIKRIVNKGFNVNLLLSSIVPLDFTPDVVHLKDRLLYFIQKGYVDMQIVLDGMNTFIYNNPMDLLIALLTRMQKRLRPSYTEIHRTISALLSALILKKEMCTFRPSISPSIDVTTILGYLQNPVLDHTLWKEADSLYVYMLNHPNEFNHLNKLIPSEKKECVLPRQCIANIVTYIENIKTQVTHEKLKTLQLIITDSHDFWKNVCLCDSHVGNKTDNVIPETTNPENDRSKNPLIFHIYGAVGFQVPVVITTTTTRPLMSSERSITYEIHTSNQAPFSTTTNITADGTTISSTAATTAVNSDPTAAVTTDANPNATAAATTTVKSDTTAATTTAATTAATTVTTVNTNGESVQTTTDQTLTQVTEKSTEPAKTTTESQVHSIEPVTLKTTTTEYPLSTPKPSKPDRKCCLLPSGVKPNAGIYVGLNIYGIPSTISSNDDALKSSTEIIILPSIMILMSPPNIEKLLVEWGTHFKTAILDPLKSIYGIEYLIKIFKTNLKIQYYPTNVALVLALLEKALMLREVSTNTKFCLVIEKYIQVINYVSIVLLMPMMSQYNHIKSNVIYSIINDNDPIQNFILEKSPKSLSQGTACFPLLHPKYYLLAIDQENPYAGLLPELSTGFQYIEYILILKQFLVTETLDKLIGSHFNPLLYPNRGTLLCAILQVLGKLPFVQQDVKLSYVVTGYLKAIRLWVMYMNVPSSFILSFPVYGSNEVPSADWKPDLPSLITMLPPAKTLTEMSAKRQMKLVLSKENLLNMIGVSKPTTDTKRSVLLIEIIEALFNSKNVWMSSILMPVLKSYVQILKTKPMFDDTISWIWIKAYTEKTEFKFNEALSNCLVYNELSYRAKIAYKSVMKYFAKHPQFLRNLPHFELITKGTQGLYLRGLFLHLLRNKKMRPSVRRNIRILIPYINLKASASLSIFRSNIRLM